MSNQDNPYSGSANAGNYQMNYKSGSNDQPGVDQGTSPPKPDLDMGTNAAPNATPSPGIQDISTAQFVAEVIEASNTMPVMVDFWAPWCGPCKQLTPILEKITDEFSGQIKLVKMDTEQYPEVAGQMGIKSIPAVVMFVGTKPVDAFMGVKSESEIRQFIEKHAGPSKGMDGEKVMGEIRELIGQKQLPEAMNLLAQFLQTDPQNPAALAMLGNIYLKSNDSERAENIFNSISPDHHNISDVATLKAELELIKQANKLGDLEQLKGAVAADGKNNQAKIDLSLAYNIAGNREEAADLLLEIIKTDRQWNEDGARKQLLKYFEAWGESDEATKSGRRKLSTALFS